MPVILATWEAEIERIMVYTSLSKEFDWSHLNGKKQYALVIPVIAGSLKQEDHGLSWPGQKARPYLPKTKQKGQEAQFKQ
jgi:hypothetical protein